ncbi:tRNA ligase subunit PheS family protein [Helicobacter suis]|uniref:tRNA ligase subunit PheS family protein n=1 Tax=Helicobacter suis TaxID=104628 RepID=UPI00220C2004|nr:hypothetical protein HSHS1_11580 [Helicobacter suis HS1]
MQVFHLSHIDLDGYGCQFVSRCFFSEIKFYNANYGREVGARLHEIITDTKKAIKMIAIGHTFRRDHDTTHTPMFSQVEGLVVDKGVHFGHLKHILEEFLQAGLEASKVYTWSFLLTERSASKITWETLKAQYPLKEGSNKEKLELLVAMINSIDIWKEGEFGFDLGKVCMRMIASTHDCYALLWN